MADCEWFQGYRKPSYTDLAPGVAFDHAGLSRDDLDQNVQWVLKKYGIVVPSELERGGIVGVVDVIDCVESHKSKWFEKGSFGWVLAKPRRLKFRPCKGALSLFRPRFLTVNARE
jgi:hypothetical protein